MAQRGRPRKERVDWNEVAKVADDGKTVSIIPPDLTTAVQQIAEAEMLYAGVRPAAPSSAPATEAAGALAPIQLELEGMLAGVQAELAASPVDTGPTAGEIAAAQEILARARLHDPDPPVSLKKEPIKLLEPEAPKLHMVDTGDVQIIAGADRIEFLRREGLLPEQRFPSPKDEPRREQPLRMSLKVQQEMEAGRRTLANHQARAMAYPPQPRTQKELDREGKSVAVIDPDFHPLQSLLRKNSEQQMGHELATGGAGTTSNSGGAPVQHSGKGGGY